RLRNGTMAGPIAPPSDGKATQKMQNAHAPIPAFPAHADEVARGPLKPRRHHVAVLVPNRSEALPVSAVAPDHPVLEEFANGLFVGGLMIHSRIPILRLMGMPVSCPARIKFGAQSARLAAKPAAAEDGHRGEECGRHSGKKDALRGPAHRKQHSADGRSHNGSDAADS